MVVTSLAAGRIGDLIGRRGTLCIGALIFTVGGAIQTFTTGFSVMVVGRIISGFGVGLLSYVLCRLSTACVLSRSIEPLCQYIRARSHHPTTYACPSTSNDVSVLTYSAARSPCLHGVYLQRLWLRFLGGMLITSADTEFFFRGSPILQWTDYFCSFIESDLSWRIPLFMQCVIGAILAAGSLLMPESPR